VAGHKDRLFPAAHISMRDAALAAREMARVARLGCRTIFVGAAPIDRDPFAWLRFRDALHLRGGRDEPEPDLRRVTRHQRAAGLRETYQVADRAEALMLVRRIVRRGDTILVKGSHSLALDQLADALVQTGAKA